MEGLQLVGPEENVTKSILEYGKDHLSEYRSQMIVAAEFTFVSFSLGFSDFQIFRFSDLQTQLIHIESQRLSS